ncbi:MAG: DUF3775 domain-containing protein [Halioglobus sp.]|nr:DUF3775 domain-containing protein [Halioglobus sp.]
MFDMHRDDLDRVIELARKFHVKEDLVTPDDAGDLAEDYSAEVLAHHQADPVLQEFRSVVGGLGPDQQQQLVAMLWLGRGDGTVEEWDSLLEQARDEWTPTTADYLIGHPLLADHLQEGIDELEDAVSDTEE